MRRRAPLRIMMVWGPLAACTFLLLEGTAKCQTPVSPPPFPPPVECPPAVSFFAPFFLPKIIQDEYRLKDFVCSEEFLKFRRTYGDVRSVDAIFDHAMRLSWNNTYEALLLSFLATMEHRNFGVRLPLLGPLLWVPLTSEFPEDFQIRVRCLPTRLYPDTPPGAAGDRDKLQHFFGSAFLTYTTESNDAAQRVGLFVEWGEEEFVVDGALDQRDIRANMEGQNFASCLLKDDSTLPSRFLKQEEGEPKERGCIPDDTLRSVNPLAEEP